MAISLEESLLVEVLGGFGEMEFLGEKCKGDAGTFGEGVKLFEFTW